VLSFGFHIRRQVGVRTYLSLKMEQTECSETSAYKIQTPGNYPKESIQHSGHGETFSLCFFFWCSDQFS